MKTVRLYEPEEQNIDSSMIHAIFANRTLVNGEYENKFNAELSKFTQGKTQVVSNGTAALHLALKSLHLPAHCEVLTSPVSFIASTNVIVQEGYIPVFGRVNRKLQLDISSVMDILQSRSAIRAIVLPNIYGLFPKPGVLRSIKSKFPNVGIIEDCAQAFPVDRKTQHIAVESDVATLSFHENKIFSSFGEGGAVVTNNQEIYADVCSRYQHGRSGQANWIDYTKLGYNYRITEVQAVAGLCGLRKIDQIMLRRRELMRSYISIFSSIDDVEIHPTLDENRSLFGFYLVFHRVTDAKRFMNCLLRYGIESRLNPMPPIYKFNHIRRYEHVVLDEGSAGIIERTLALPLRSELSSKYYIDIVKKATKEYLNDKNK